MISMQKIGIIGAKGFLGSAICKKSKDFDFNIIEITRENYEKNKSENFNILINTATPSKKYWASKNPYDDFNQTVKLTADITYNWNYKKLIQISSISVNDLASKHPYALNKKAAEIITNYKTSMIIRLSSLYGVGLTKGPLYDLLSSQKIFVDIDSEYSFINTDFVAEWILNNLNKTGLVQLGAIDTISLREIANKMNLDVTWEGQLEQIYSKDIEEGMPSCKEIWKFINDFNIKK